MNMRHSRHQHANIGGELAVCCFYVSSSLFFIEIKLSGFFTCQDGCNATEYNLNNGRSQEKTRVELINQR